MEVENQTPPAQFCDVHSGECADVVLGVAAQTNTWKTLLRSIYDICPFLDISNEGEFFALLFLWILGAYAIRVIIGVFVTRFFSETKKQKTLYTRIKGEWYDLAEFDHPGGPIALKLAQDRDSTALFESHHMFISHKKVYAILNKYKVKGVKASELEVMDKSEAHYEWEGYGEDPFVVDMKAMLFDHFNPIAKKKGISIHAATKATTFRWIEVISLMVTFFASLPYFFKGQWWALVVTPVMAWLALCNYWHDCLHFAMSTNWKINAFLPYLFPWLSSPWLWYHQHTVGHHSYTNVGKLDPDLAHAPQLMREHGSVKWRKTHSSQHRWPQFAFVYSVAVGLGLNLLSDIRANMKLTYNNAVPYRELDAGRMFVHALGRVFYVCALFVWPFFVFPAWKATIWAIVPITIFSWCFMLSSQVNHLTDNTAHASSTNFLKHQVLTSQDFGRNSWLCRFLSGGLNTQIEHHLFPTINHCHIPALQPKVEAICKKHGVQYNSVDTYAEAFRTHVEHTRKMGIRPFSDDH